MTHLVAGALLVCVACNAQPSAVVDAAAPMASVAAPAPSAAPSVPAQRDDGPGPDDQFHVVTKPAAHEGDVTLRCTEEPDTGCICNGKSLDPCATKTTPTMKGHECTYACAASEHVVRLQCLTGVGVAPGGCTCGDAVINPCAGGKTPTSVKRDGDFCAVTCGGAG